MKKRVVMHLPVRTFRKLHKLKNEQGFQGKTWEEWAAHLTKNISLIDQFSDAISRGTREGLGEMWMENFIMNVRTIVDYDTYPENKDHNSIGMLPKHEDEPALVVAAGPSIYAQKHISLLAERGFNGNIITTDRMLIPLLKEGVVPQYVASVDGNRDLILKWFDDPLVDEHAHQIKGMFTSTSAPNAIQRFLDAGGEIFWFHGMLDNFYELDSVTSFLNYMTGSTAISCGGNVGSTCWMLAHYLKCDPIIFIGLDLGYTKETPIEETAYYKTIAETTHSIEQIQSFFRDGVNPDFGNPYYTDLVFVNYKEALLEMISKVEVETINATEGGCLFGPGVKGMKFADVLEKYGE